MLGFYVFAAVVDIETSSKAFGQDNKEECKCM